MPFFLFLQALQHKLALEASRMAELESLLGRMRSSQFKGEFDAQSTSERTQQLQERTTLLEEQVRLFQAAAAPCAALTVQTMSSCEYTRRC